MYLLRSSIATLDILLLLHLSFYYISVAHLNLRHVVSLHNIILHARIVRVRWCALEANLFLLIRR